MTFRSLSGKDKSALYKNSFSNVHGSPSTSRTNCSDEYLSSAESNPMRYSTDSSPVPSCFCRFFIALFRFLPKLRMAVMQNDSNILQRAISLSEGGVIVPSLPFSRYELVLLRLLAYLKHISLGQTGKVSKKISKNFWRVYMLLLRKLWWYRKKKRANPHKADRPSPQRARMSSCLFANAYNPPK